MPSYPAGRWSVLPRSSRPRKWAILRLPSRTRGSKYAETGALPVYWISHGRRCGSHAGAPPSWPSRCTTFTDMIGEGGHTGGRIPLYERNEEARVDDKAEEGPWGGGGERCPPLSSLFALSCFSPSSLPHFFLSLTPSQTVQERRSGWPRVSPPQKRGKTRGGRAVPKQI
eukprot:scaffold50433_cov38-Tisochrysis_lutea.AAC.3